MGNTLKASYIHVKYLPHYVQAKYSKANFVYESKALEELRDAITALASFYALAGLD